MHVSFRNRLTFFFILLVILPVLAVAAVGLLIVENAESSSTEDQVQTARKTARARSTSPSQDNAEAVAGTFAQDDSIATAIRDNDEQKLEKRLAKLIEDGHGEAARGSISSARRRSTSGRTTRSRPRGRRSRTTARASGRSSCPRSPRTTTAGS